MHKLNSDARPYNPCQWQWLTNIKLSRIVLLVLAILILTPLISHFYLSNVERNASLMTHNAHSHVDLPDDLDIREIDLRVGVEELVRIRGSVLSELRNIEKKRQLFKQELQVSVMMLQILCCCYNSLQSYSKNIEDLKLELVRQQTNLNQLKISVEQAEMAMHEALQQNTPDLALPQKLLPNELPPQLPAIPKNRSRNCRMFTCFDHSRYVTSKIIQMSAE